MGASRKTLHTGQRSKHNVAIDALGNPELEKLHKDFEEFRRTHQLRTRIPDSLRLATLKALQNGMSESKVRSICGITTDQIAYWRQKYFNHDASEPRVYPVNDEVPSTDHPDANGSVSQNLVLRIGGWAISIRQVL